MAAAVKGENRFEKNNNFFRLFGRQGSDDKTERCAGGRGKFKKNHVGDQIVLVGDSANSL